MYQRVYEKLNKLFMGVAPKWMQELAERARTIAEEIKKLSEELEKAAGMSSYPPSPQRDEILSNKP
jgi:predicted ATP-grasp superfamily ATP-dependent carboligase